MIRTISLLLVCLCLTLGCSPKTESDPAIALTPEAQLAEGQKRARVCMSCHGPRGISRVASYPSLAGKPQEYLITQLKAFRSGDRKNPMMSSMALSLTDENIFLLSFYFSSQTP